MKNKLTHSLLILLASIGLSTQAKAGGDYELSQHSQHEQVYNGYNDPIEGVNRAIFKFNDAVDTVILHPVTKGYRFVVPQQGRKAFRNVLRNVRSPINMAHNLLQGDVSGAGKTFFRFVVNTFAGFGGIVDVAAWEGIEYESEDLGQTLAVWGVGDGPYVVVPIFGPASLRDAIGFGIDGYFDPISRYGDNIEEDAIIITNSVVGQINQKDQYMDLLEDLKANSLDYYASLRDVVYQRRLSLINDGAMTWEEQPEFVDYED